MGRPAATVTPGAAAQDALPRARNTPLRGRRGIRILLRRAARWLDNWALRGYPNDTYDWASKAERLRSLKNTLPARPGGGADPNTHPFGENGKNRVREGAVSGPARRERPGSRVALAANPGA